MDFEQAKTAATGFIGYWYLDGGLFSKRGDESWQILNFVDRLLSNPGEVVTKANEDPQAFRQTQQAAAHIFRLMHIAETEELDELEQDSFSKIHIPKELYPWLAKFLADRKPPNPKTKSKTATKERNVEGSTHTFTHNNNRNFIIACAVKKLIDQPMKVAGNSTDREESVAAAVARALKDLGQRPETPGSVLDVYYEVINEVGFSDPFPDEPWFPKKEKEN